MFPQPLVYLIQSHQWNTPLISSHVTCEINVDYRPLELVQVGSPLDLHQPQGACDVDAWYGLERLLVLACLDNKACQDKLGPTRV